MQQRNRHLVLKAVLGLIVLFLAAVGIRDWTPERTTVEKTVTYATR